MLSIRSSAAIARALDSPIDEDLKKLLVRRCDQLSEYNGYDLGELVHILIVERGDRLTELEAELGFAITNEAPSWEYIQAGEGWFEIVFIISDDGYGAIVFVKDEQGESPELLTLCRASVGNDHTRQHGQQPPTA